MLCQQKRILFFLVISVGMFSWAGALKAQDKAEDEFAGVRQVSDSVVAVLAKAILQRDSALLSSIFIDDFHVLMPGRIPHRGKADIMKYVTLFFEKAGGWKLTTSRHSLESIVKTEGFVREIGRYEMVEPTEQGAGKTWKGNYLAIWRPHDKKWVLNNMLLSKD